MLPDRGYTRYDPNPRTPGAGSGFLHTPTVETVIPVSPSAALVVKRGQGRIGLAQGNAAYADDLNLHAYAQSLACIYGRRQQDVVDVHLLARRNRSGVNERRRRARGLWILEGQEGAPEGRPIRGVGHSVEGVREAWFTIDPEPARASNLSHRGTCGDRRPSDRPWTAPTARAELRRRNLPTRALRYSTCGSPTLRRRTS